MQTAAYLDGPAVAAVLDEYAAMVRSELARYLAPREPGRYLYDLAADYPRRGGRCLRASICLATATALGASPDAAIKTACAIELMHCAFLVHDDVEDESDERRGAPTLHRLHGTPIAINVGDALALIAMRPLFDNRARLGPRLAQHILEEAHNTVRESIEGQALELGWRADNALDVSPEDYLQMVLKKTCFYTTIFPCRAGALIGKQDPRGLSRYTRFCFFLGAAFQIQDDLLNLVGDAERYGKELNGDLLEGKRTLPLLHTVQLATPQVRAQLHEMLALPRGARTDEHVRFIRAHMQEHGSIEYAHSVAHGMAGAARHEFELAFSGISESREKSFLRSLPAWMLSRT